MFYKATNCTKNVVGRFLDQSAGYIPVLFLPGAYQFIFDNKSLKDNGNAGKDHW